MSGQGEGGVTDEMAIRARERLRQMNTGLVNWDGGGYVDDETALLRLRSALEAALPAGPPDKWEQVASALHTHLRLEHGHRSGHWKHNRDPGCPRCAILSEFERASSVPPNGG